VTHRAVNGPDKVKDAQERTHLVTDESAGTRPRIRRLVGVYNAEGTLRGELTYWVGARLGRAHCALCDITHGSVRERTDWKTCRAGLPVPFDTYHLNDQPDTIRAAISDQAPVVIAETDQGLFTLLGPAALEGCDSSTERFNAALTHAAEHHNLDWP
jgi:hypothetical protein